MNVEEIRKIARHHGLKPGRQTKVKLVRSIQEKEGNFACFGTAVSGQCDQLGCLWRKDCFDAARKLQ